MGQIERIQRSCSVFWSVSAFKCKYSNDVVLSDLNTKSRLLFVYLCVRLGECWRSSGFGQNCSRSGNCGRSIPYSGNDLTLGVEKQLWGDSLDLESLEGEGGSRSPSSQRSWVHQQWEGSYNL